MSHVLIVDDSPYNRKYLERIIRHRTQHSVGFAETSLEAVERMVDRRPDLIFLDLFIPGDGIVLFDNLRVHPATASIPIVIHSAVPLDAVTSIRLRKMQHDGFIEFPVAATELVNRIDMALRRNAAVERRWVPPKV